MSELMKPSQRPGGDSARAGETLLQIRGLEKHFPLSGDFLEQLHFEGGKLKRRQEFVHAINGVDIDVKRGETLCVVGESGCGKSTVARMVMGLLHPSAGEIRYDGQRIDDLSPRQLLPYRRRMQMIFQNPYASLNPRMSIQQTLEEPLRFHHPDWNPQQILDKIAEGDGLGRHRPGMGQALRSRVLGGPASTHRHRPGAGRGTRVHCRRRTDLGA